MSQTIVVISLVEKCVEVQRHTVVLWCDRRKINGLGFGSVDKYKGDISWQIARNIKHFFLEGHALSLSLSKDRSRHNVNSFKRPPKDPQKTLRLLIFGNV